MRENDEWIIKINYFDEREYVGKREIDTKISMTPKGNGTKLLPVLISHIIHDPIESRHIG